MTIDIFLVVYQPQIDFKRMSPRYLEFSKIIFLLLGLIRYYEGIPFWSLCGHRSVLIDPVNSGIYKKWSFCTISNNTEPLILDRFKYIHWPFCTVTEKFYFAFKKQAHRDLWNFSEFSKGLLSSSTKWQEINERKHLSYQMIAF